MKNSSGLGSESIQTSSSQSAFSPFKPQEDLFSRLSILVFLLTLSLGVTADHVVYYLVKIWSTTLINSWGETLQDFQLLFIGDASLASLTMLAVASAGFMLFIRRYPWLTLAIWIGVNLVILFPAQALYPHMWIQLLIILGTFACHRPRWTAAMLIAIYASLGALVMLGAFANRSRGTYLLFLIFLLLYCLTATCTFILFSLRYLYLRYEYSLAKENAKQAQEKERLTTLVKIQERNRIAREMHDVLAHSLTVLITQSDGGRFAAKAGNWELATQALDTISTVGREALNDVRKTIGILRLSTQTAGSSLESETSDKTDLPLPLSELTNADSDSQTANFAGSVLNSAFSSALNGSTEVEEATVNIEQQEINLNMLINRVRDSGTHISFLSQGRSGHLSRSCRATLYRICQESITNALKHGGAKTQIFIHLEYLPDKIKFKIENTNRAGFKSADLNTTAELTDVIPNDFRKIDSFNSLDSSQTTGLALATESSTFSNQNGILHSGPGGNGLLGMQERVELLGGHLEAGPKLDTPGWVVSGSLPY